MRYRIMAAVMAVAASFGHLPAARAGLIPIQVSVMPEGGNYQYTYALVLPVDSVLQTGNYFTIYNFAGLVPGSAMASGSSSSQYWAFSSSLLGLTPPGISVSQNPNVPDITWTYSGPSIQGAQNGLGNFSAVSIYPLTTLSWMTAITGTVNGVADANITPTTVPVPAAPGSPPPGVPEPATLALIGFGLPFFGLLQRLRRRSAKPAAE